MNLLLKKIIKIVGDLINESTRVKTVNETISKFGSVNTLINNAAIFRLSHLVNTKIDEYDEIMNVNVRSVFLLTQLCVPYLLKEKRSSIVNVSSIAGTRCFPGLLPYSMSKAALDQFTKCLSLELASNQCRVNSVNPGTIVTNIHRRAGYNEEQYKMFIETCKKTHALGRAGNADEVANTIAFLASDAASFITGEVIHVDGGRQRMSPR